MCVNVQSIFIGNAGALLLLLFRKLHLVHGQLRLLTNIHRGGVGNVLQIVDAVAVDKAHTGTYAVLVVDAIVIIAAIAPRLFRKIISGNI